MHVSRYFVRGCILFMLGYLIPHFAEDYISAHGAEFPQGISPMSSAGLYLIGVLCVVFAIGQLQYVFSLLRLNETLRKSLAGKKRSTFVTSTGEDGTAKRYHGGFRIEIVAHDSFDTTVFIISRRMIQAHRQVLVGVLSDGSSRSTPKEQLEVVVLNPDYRSEMRLLNRALETRSYSKK